MRRLLRLAVMAWVLLLALACPALGAPGARARAVGGPAAVGAVALAASRPPQGAAVVVSSPEATAAAKLLARRAYQEPSLRPELDEATAAALVGVRTPCESPPCDDRLAEVHELVNAVGAACSGSCQGSPVARHLLTSLGRDLGVAWIVLVQPAVADADGQRPPSVHLLRVTTGRFEPMVLSAKPAVEPDESMWDEVVPILRSVVGSTARADAVSSTQRPSGAPTAGKALATPSKPAKGTSPPAASPAVEAEEDDEVRVLSSPWFWGGLGVLVAAGITVFALSQSSLGETDTVQLEGRVAP